MTSSLKSRFDFVNRRALIVTSDRAIVYHWHKQHLSSGYIFALTDDGLSRFEQYLKENYEDPVYVITDLADEEFKYDTIPHVGMNDRKTIVKRRLSRLFRSSSYSYYEIQGREPENRRDDKVLFASLSEDESISPWVDRLLACKVPIAGLYSVALLTRYLLEPLGHEGGPGLVVSLERNAGLRQTFFLNRDFKFSRLVRMPRYGTEPYAPVIRDEIDKMLRYLRSMRYLSTETLAKIYILGDQTLLKELKQECHDRAGIEFSFISLDHASRKIGLSFDFVDPFSESIYAYLALKNRPRNIYATEQETRYYQIRNIRNFMLGSSILILLTSLIWGGITFMEAVTLKQQSMNAKSKTDFYQTRYDIARERLPELPVEPRALETAVNIASSLRQYKARPLPMIQILSSVLGSFPKIQINSIDWLAATNPDASPASLDSSKQSNTGSVEGRGDNGYLYYQIAEIKGYIAPFDGNYRQAIGRINQLVETLRQKEHVYNTKILALPLDVSPESKLRGAADTIPSEAEFAFRVVLGMPHED